MSGQWIMFRSVRKCGWRIYSRFLHRQELGLRKLSTILHLRQVPPPHNFPHKLILSQRQRNSRPLQLPLRRRRPQLRQHRLLLRKRPTLKMQLPNRQRHLHHLRRPEALHHHPQFWQHTLHLPQNNIHERAYNHNIQPCHLSHNRNLLFLLHLTHKFPNSSTKQQHSPQSRPRRRAAPRRSTGRSRRRTGIFPPQAPSAAERWRPKRGAVHPAG